MSSLEKLNEIASTILNKSIFRPKIAIICGSGLGGLIELVKDSVVFPYSEIDGFPKSTVAGHAGNLVFGYLGGKEVVLMQGRFHPYEGYSTETCAIPVRVMHLIGVKYLLLTNAAGGLNPSYQVGDLMIIKDHINFPGICGFNPLVGTNKDSLGERFIPLSDAYDKDLRLKAKKIVEKLGVLERVHEGVYVMQFGPAFETVSECLMMKMWGGDACEIESFSQRNRESMSTTHEVITARHMGMSVFGISLITNECILEHDSETKVDHVQVLEVAKKKALVMQKIIEELVYEIIL